MFAGLCLLVSYSFLFIAINKISFSQRMGGILNFGRCEDYYHSDMVSVGRGDEHSVLQEHLTQCLLETLTILGSNFLFLIRKPGSIL